MSKNTYSIAVLLPTHERTDALTRSVQSIVNQADQPDTLQIIFGVDNDDTIGKTHLEEVIRPWLDKQNITYTIVEFEPLTYYGLNSYYNGTAAEADADWLFVWNDDAYMDTKGWDTVVRKYNGEFKCLKLHTHNEHPYSIFPIYPKEWYDLFGFLARHQMIDAELSQNAYMLDLMEVIDVHAVHDRADLTGNNNDATQKEKLSRRLEGNPKDPRDFHHTNYINARLSDCEIISQHLKSKGKDMSFWDNVKLGKQDPWDKMRENDPNGQVVRIPINQL
jgi:hypothetical protein